MQRFGILCIALLAQLVLFGTLMSMNAQPLFTGEGTLLFLLAGVGFVVFLIMIYFELNLAFADPDLALAQMIWAVTIIIGSAWLAADMRPVLLLTGTALLLTGTHRLSRKNLYWFVGVASLIYALLCAQTYLSDPDQLHQLPGIMEILAFGVVLFIAPLLIRFEKNLMQSDLVRRDRQLGVALEQISTLAVRDELTGAFNQRQLADVLHHQKAMADRRNYGFSICFVDLDYFKRVNSLFGRHTGDLALKEFVRIAGSVVREVDCVARVGGEEFVLVLGGATEQDAWVVAQRLRSLLQEMKISSCAPDYRISASIGISRYRAKESVELTMQRAASCLVQARNGGRDRIIIADDVLDASIAG
jgi:diguanylate cyclase (GGDEF)-like protein